MDGLPAAVDVPVQEHGAEHLQLGGLVGRVQRQVRILPVPPDAHPERRSCDGQHEQQGGTYLGIERSHGVCWLNS